MTMIYGKERLPTTIKLVDVEYRVEYVEQSSEVDPAGRQAHLGSIDTWARVIRILVGNDRTLADIRQTLWHEIVHAIMEKFCIEAKESELVNDERVVDLLATGINVVLQENPELRY